MMPYQSYQVYQAERTKTAAEIRRADEQVGHMAENLSWLWQHATRPIALLRGAGRSTGHSTGHSTGRSTGRSPACSAPLDASR